MRRRVMIGSNKGVEGKEGAVVGDILCAKEDGSKKIFKASDYANISGSGWTPIGIVVIPPSHNIYGTGEGAAMSLNYMNPSNPDNGGAGSPMRIVLLYGMTERRGLVVIDNNESQKISGYLDAHEGYAAAIPTDKYDKTSSPKSCIDDSNSYYYKSANTLAHPYLSNGDRNPLYTHWISGYDVDGNYDESNYDSDGNLLVNITTGSGKPICEQLVNKISLPSDWKTAQTLSYVTDNSSYNTAVACSWRYHPTGTKQGDWYLPSMMEMGYIINRRITINTTISNISQSTGKSYSDITSSYYGTVTLSFNFAYIHGSVGIIDDQTSRTGIYWRAITRF